MAKHRTQEEKEELIQLFKSSGLSKQDFCTTRKVSSTSLRSWMKQESKKPITFVQLTDPQDKHTIASTPDSSIHLEWKGIRLTFPLDTNVAYLGEVIKVITHV